MNVPGKKWLWLLSIPLVFVGARLFSFLAPSAVMDSGRNPVVVSQLGMGDDVIKLLRMKLFPFTGYHAAPNMDEDSVYHGTRFKLKTNSLGFLTPYEFDAIHEPPFKGHGKTKVVLVTGGSAA